MTYIRNIEQISIQEPLSEKWFDSPLPHSSQFNEGVDPEFRQFISPAAGRRMGRLFKRATVTSAKAIEGFAAENLDGIVTGTGLGCMENTEKFLVAMLENGEKFLQPTYFMQSTHNTIGSQIALQLGCHGYNCTYSHSGNSFDGALLDAFVQMKLGRLRSVLVGAHEEMTPNFFKFLGEVGYWKEGEADEAALRRGDTPGTIAGICSLSMLLTDEPGHSHLCRIADMAMLHSPDSETLARTAQDILQRNGLSGFDAVVCGLSGDAANDEIYRACFDTVYGGAPVLWYKHIFGECFCASAFGAYLGAECLSKGSVPAHTIYKGICGQPRNILVHNHFKNLDHSLTLLTC